MDIEQRNEFAQKGFVNLGKILSEDEVDCFDKLFKILPYQLSLGCGPKGSMHPCLILLL